MSPSPDVRGDVSLLTSDDLHLFNEGTHYRLWERLGSHPLPNQAGTVFGVWAPNAQAVSVVGDFNGWDPARHPLKTRESSGIWEGHLSGVGAGTLYKYAIRTRTGAMLQKADPFAVHAETPPKSASIVWGLDYEWGDSVWMRTRGSANALSAPMSIYEVHLGSWRRRPEDGGRPLTYREAAPLLAEYARDLGFTHVELLPLMEHPFYGSWGYQVTGYFAPTSRYGTPQDLMAFVDTLHQAGVGVILDWVPSHFATDGHGLSGFDGTCLFEHTDPKEGFHPDWGSAIFNYGRHEVRSFLISNARYWLECYHLDGLRVDAVASMLYRDYSRREGEWIPNVHGGRENLEAIDFLRRFNAEAYGAHPDIVTVAEESTAWPMVSRPVHLGGLGFGLKWDMGWMHDWLDYMGRDAVHRKWHHNQTTFRMLYAFHENFVLPLSHDEVVHGKRSLLERMPGDDWQKFANLRLLLGAMHGQPGKKLLFMGGEFGQRNEWHHESSLDWHLLSGPLHAGLRRWVRDLNRVHRLEPALHELDADPRGFEWADCTDWEHSVLAWMRRGRADNGRILVACNFTPVPRNEYRLGVPYPGTWREILNSDGLEYAGSGMGNAGRVDTHRHPSHHHPHSLVLTLPPLGVLFLRHEEPAS